MTKVHAKGAYAPGNSSFISLLKKTAVNYWRFLSEQRRNETRGTIRLVLRNPTAHADSWLIHDEFAEWILVEAYKTCQRHREQECGSLVNVERFLRSSFRTNLRFLSLPHDPLLDVGKTFNLRRSPKWDKSRLEQGAKNRRFQSYRQTIPDLQSLPLDRRD